MADMFDKPASAAGISWADLKGRLLLITPHSAERIQTAFGESDCIRADVAVIDGANPDTYNDTLIFPRVLASQVRPNAGTGRMNLGRLTTGAAKPGQSAPWVLQDPTEEDKVIARAWLAKNEPAPF